MKCWKRVIRFVSIMLVIGAGSLAMANSLKMKPPADCAEGDSRAICFPGEGGGNDIGGAETGGEDQGGGNTNNGGNNDGGNNNGGTEVGGPSFSNSPD